MITIDLLKNHPHCISQLVEIWYTGIGKVWLPDICIDRVKEKLQQHLNDNTLPLTFVALKDEQPIGMCSLRETEDIRPEIKPWLGSLVVHPAYQKKGIAKRLIDTTKHKAKEFGFDKLYLLTFDLTLVGYYARLGWVINGTDQFEQHPVTVMELYL